MNRILQPEEWPRPSGYANGVAASGTLIFVSGQIGWDAQGRIVSEDLTQQVRRALENTVRVLQEAGARPEHIVRMTWFLTDKRAYVQSRKEIGEAYRGVMGKSFPAMSVVFVDALVEDGAKVEIETTAVIPG